VGNPRSSASSVREQKLARVIDREVAPIWHDRFARLLLRELPGNSGTFVLDIHSGPGHTTAELLQRLDESSRVVALGRDPWLMQVSKTRVRPEWKRRVYFKAGDMDDVPAMADATYDLAIANLVLGEQVVDWQAALAELVRVTKPGGQVLATLPLYGTWDEVEDLFEELLRDEDMRREVVTLQKLRRRRPKPSHLVAGLQELGIGDNDVVFEHERFELLFRSGREFLFAPVIEHGPLRLWKAIIGRAEKPQALFWRFKEAIDTYYAGHVLAVTVVAGLIRVRVPGNGVQDSFAAQYWSRYPSLARLWGAPGAAAELSSRPGRADLPEDDDFDLDMDVDVEEPAIAPAADSSAAISRPGDSGSGFEDSEVSLSELPALEDAPLGEDPFAGLLEQLDASQAAAAEVAAEDAAAEARRVVTPTIKAATLGALGESPSGLRPMPRKPGESGASPLPGRLPRKPGESGASPLPKPLPTRSGESGASPLPKPLPTRPGESGASPLPKPPVAATKPGESGASPLPKPPTTESGAAPLPKPPRAGTAPTTAMPTLPPGAAAKPGRVQLPGMAPRVAPPPPRTGPAPIVGSPPKPVAPAAVTPPVAVAPATPVPEPRATKPGEDDPFAGMLTDDEDDIHEIDEVDELASLVDGEIQEDDDLASSFGDVAPGASNSGMRRTPPPPPGPPKKK
jgi:ubiquinone/menaquinone biosynthesis C-methylase UbiE